MKTYESEKLTYVDKETGATVTRLTGAYSNSNHLYFTNNCFYDEGILNKRYSSAGRAAD